MSKTKSFDHKVMSSEYKRWYDRGWQYAQRDESVIEHGDKENYPVAWFDGYLDASCGKDKYHSVNCPECSRGEGCCS